MVDIVREDAPWVWGMHSKSFSLSQHWMSPDIPHNFGGNTLKYTWLNPQLRIEKIQAVESSPYLASRVADHSAHFWLRRCFMANVLSTTPARNLNNMTAHPTS